MEKVSLRWDELVGSWLLFFGLELFGLIRVALRLALLRQIVSSYQIYGFRILGARSVWGTKDSWKGPYDIKAMVVISLSHLI